MKALDRHAKDPTLGESFQIKMSSTSSSTHFFIEVIFGTPDDIGALWNPPIVDHVVPNQLKMDPLADLEAKAVQSANWGSILLARDLFCGVKPTSKANKIYVEPHNPQFMARQFGLTQHLHMAFLTMTSPTSRLLLSTKKVKKITDLTHQMRSLFRFHMFLLDHKKTTSFLNWPSIKDAYF